MVVAVSTDKVTRPIADVKGIVMECGAKLDDVESIVQTNTSCECKGH